MRFQFPQHDASTFPQVVCKTPKDKSACRAQFLASGPGGTSERLWNNVQEGAPELKVMQDDLSCIGAEGHRTGRQRDRSRSSQVAQNCHAGVTLLSALLSVAASPGS